MMLSMVFSFWPVVAPRITNVAGRIEQPVDADVPQKREV